MLNSAGEQMRAGAVGQAIIRWNQTEIDGLEAAPLSELSLGAVWSWRGVGVKLASFEEPSRTNAHGANAVVQRNAPGAVAEALPSGQASLRIELSNGAQRFQAVLIQISSEEMPALYFENDCPMREQDFWISAIETVAEAHGAISEPENVIAFPDLGHREGTEPDAPAAVAAE